MREQFRIGSRLSWVVAWLLALAAPAMYLLWPTTVTWLVGMLLVVPIVGLVAWRADQKGYTDPYPGGGDGPWGPPSLSYSGPPTFAPAAVAIAGRGPSMQLDMLVTLAQAADPELYGAKAGKAIAPGVGAGLGTIGPQGHQHPGAPHPCGASRRCKRTCGSGLTAAASPPTARSSSPARIDGHGRLDEDRLGQLAPPRLRSRLRAVALPGARPYKLRHSVASLLLHEAAR